MILMRPLLLQWESEASDNADGYHKPTKTEKSYEQEFQRMDES